MRKLFDLLFGCQHSHRSFPLTPRSGKGTYEVCLDCGKEMPYDWANLGLPKAS